MTLQMGGDAAARLTYFTPCGIVRSIALIMPGPRPGIARQHKS
jgi:hypothetical protein